MNASTIKRILLLLTLMPALIAGAKENTKRKNLTPADKGVKQETVAIDSVIVDDALQFTEGIVTMKGYSKLTGANKESFMLVNHSNLHLSGLEIRFKYTDLDGAIIHERTATVECDLPPFQSRQVSIKSFDEGHRFYYYRSKAQKGAIAYDLTIKIKSYNIKISRNE